MSSKELDANSTASLAKFPQPTFATSNDVQVVSDCPTEPSIHKYEKINAMQFPIDWHLF